MTGQYYLIVYHDGDLTNYSIVDEKFEYVGPTHGSKEELFKFSDSKDICRNDIVLDIEPMKLTEIRNALDYGGTDLIITVSQLEEKLDS